MSLSTVEHSLSAAEARYQQDVGKAKALAAEGQRAKQQAEQHRATEVACEEAVAFLNSFADERQATVQRRIETLVSYGLQTIFDEAITFHVVSEQKANRTEVSFVLRSTMDGQLVETPILDARGGGVAAVVGFLLRLIITLLRKHRQLLVLDETFAHLSTDREPVLGEFIRELVDQTGVQIIMVTHSDSYSEHADRVYRFSQKDGKTVIEDADTSGS